MRIPRLRQALAAAAVALIGLSSLAVSGSASAADLSAAASNNGKCERGEVCVYMGNKVVADSEGNLNGTYGPWDVAGKVVNNGWPWPGADHIRYTLRVNGNTSNICLHFPGDGNNVGAIPAGGVVTDVRWGGDC